MTTNERLETRSGAVRRLLALAVGFVLALLGFVVSAGPAGAQTRVGPQPVQTIFTVGPTSAAAPGSVGVRGPPLHQQASATGVAADSESTIQDAAATTAALTEREIGTTVDDVLQDASFYKQSQATQYLKSGGFGQANADFDALVQGVSIVERGGGLRTATLSNGTKINVRPFSSGKYPTLEIGASGFSVGSSARIRGCTR